MGRLSTKARKKLPRKDFAEPRKRKYPDDTKARARSALARVAHWGTPTEKKEVRRRIKAKYPSMKVKGL